MSKPKRIKIRVGQIWQRNRNGSLIQITGNARMKNGLKRFNTTRYDSATRVCHSMSEREIATEYKQVKEADVLHLRVTRPKYKGYNRFRHTTRKRKPKREP